MQSVTHEDFAHPRLPMGAGIERYERICGNLFERKPFYCQQRVVTRDEQRARQARILEHDEIGKSRGRLCRQREIGLTGSREPADVIGGSVQQFQLDARIAGDEALQHGRKRISGERERGPDAELPDPAFDEFLSGRLDAFRVAQDDVRDLGDAAARFRQIDDAVAAAYERDPRRAPVRARASAC